MVRDDGHGETWTSPGDPLKYGEGKMVETRLETDIGGPTDFEKKWESGRLRYCMILRNKRKVQTIRRLHDPTSQTEGSNDGDELDEGRA